MKNERVASYKLAVNGLCGTPTTFIRREQNKNNMLMLLMYFKERETHYSVGGKLNDQKMEIDIEM